MSIWMFDTKSEPDLARNSYLYFPFTGISKKYLYLF
jgi:hypothetical protein